MVNIKRFIDRVSAMDTRSGKDLVIPGSEARLLRDEIVKILVDRVEQQNRPSQDTIQLTVSGGGFK